MRMRQRLSVAAVVCAVTMCALATSALAVQSAPSPGDAGWEDALAAFAAADHGKTPEPGAVLFVGSSSISLWDNLEADFRDSRVIKRGFGGSRLSDCVRLLDRLVIRYRPRAVLLYAGDNDLAEGSTPEEVAARVKAFADGVHRRLPETRITFISIKPSPARRALLAKMRAANRLVQDYAKSHPKVDYVDVFTPMLSAEGAPRRELFRKDALHLNDAGYALWRSVIRPFVR